MQQPTGNVGVVTASAIAPQANGASAAQTAVQPSSATLYRNVALGSLFFAIGGLILGASAPQCQSHFYYSYGYYYYPAAWCVSQYAVWPEMVALTFIAMCLVMASLYQLSTKSPAEANTPHFHCMNIWAIVLASLSLGAAFPAAIMVSTKHEGEHRCGYYSYYYGYNYNCNQSQRAVLEQRERDSWPHHIIYAISVWWWFIFTIATVVVPARTKYWCCKECKKDPNCAPVAGADPESCNTCVCCLESGGEPQQGTAMVVVGANVSQPVALAVGGGAVPPVVMPQGYVQQPQMMIQQPYQPQYQPAMSEVQFWLTNEVRLPQYLPAFLGQGYERMQAVVFGINSEADLRKIVPDILPGHVHLMLGDIQMKRQRFQMPQQQQFAPSGVVVAEGNATQ